MNFNDWLEAVPKIDNQPCNLEDGGLPAGLFSLVNFPGTM